MVAERELGVIGGALVDTLRARMTTAVSCGEPIPHRILRISFTKTRSTTTRGSDEQKQGEKRNKGGPSPEIGLSEIDQYPTLQWPHVLWWVIF